MELKYIGVSEVGFACHAKGIDRIRAATWHLPWPFAAIVAIYRDHFGAAEVVC